MQQESFVQNFNLLFCDNNELQYSKFSNIFLCAWNLFIVLLTVILIIFVLQLGARFKCFLCFFILYFRWQYVQLWKVQKVRLCIHNIDIMTWTMPDFDILILFVDNLFVEFYLFNLTHTSIHSCICSLDRYRPSKFPWK